MTKNELKNIIKEEYKNIIKESKNSVNSIYYKIKELGADEMELLFILLANYFKSNSSDLDNMDAKGIAKDLNNAYKKIANRDSN